MDGFVYVGEIVDGQVEADIYVNGHVITISGRVWFTLDQWLEARRLYSDDEYTWIATKAEYAEATMTVDVES